MRYFSVVLAVQLCGCAMTYEQPAAVAPEVSSQLNAPRSDTIAAAKRTLVLEGFQITDSDDTAGIISTAPRNMKLTPEHADCGKTMGIDYLKDKRTSTMVGYAVIVSDQKISVKVNIDGEYKPGSVTQDLSLTCVSRGTLERTILEKIADAAK